MIFARRFKDFLTPRAAEAARPGAAGGTFDPGVAALGVKVATFDPNVATFAPKVAAFGPFVGRFGALVATFGSNVPEHLRAVVHAAGGVAVED